MTVTTKDLISNALYNELSKEDLHKFTVSDLAKKIHIARSTLYYQFSSLNDVYSYLLDTHFFDKINQKNGYCEFIQHIGEFIDCNQVACCNLMNIVDSDVRHRFLFEKFYDYLINCSSFTAVNKYHKSEEFQKEIRILAKSLIFQIELWLQEDGNIRDFNNNLQHHFRVTRRNLIMKRRRRIFSKHIKN